VFIHLGGSRMIRIGDVVAIVDAGGATTSGSRFSFIETAKKEGRLEKISTEEVKSYVITNVKVYGSPISSLTLMKRAEQSQRRLK
jgi:extracellular matrix regulatory protein B